MDNDAVNKLKSLYDDECYISFFLEAIAYYNENSKEALDYRRVLDRLTDPDKYSFLFSENVKNSILSKISHISSNNGHSIDLRSAAKKISVISYSENKLIDEKGVITLLGYNSEMDRGTAFEISVGFSDKISSQASSAFAESFYNGKRAFDEYLLSEYAHIDKKNLSRPVCFERKRLMSGQNYCNYGGRSYSLGLFLAYYSLITSKKIPKDIAVTGWLESNCHIETIKHFEKKVEAIVKERPYIKRLIYPEGQSGIESAREIIESNNCTLQLLPVSSFDQALCMVFGEDIKETVNKELKDKFLMDGNKKSAEILYKVSLSSKNFHLSNYVGREYELNKITGWINSRVNTDESTLFVTGGPGIGKSRLTFELIKKLEDGALDKNTILIPFFLSPESPFTSFFKRAVYELIAWYPYGDDSGNSDNFRNIIEEIYRSNPELKIVLIIDGLDEVLGHNKKNDFIEFLFNYRSPNLLKVLTGQNINGIAQFIAMLPEADRLTLDCLNYEQIRQFVRNEISEGGRLVSIGPEKRHVLESEEYLKRLEILTKGNPLFLDLHIRSIETYEEVSYDFGLDLRLDKYLNKDMLNEYIVKLYQRIDRRYKKSLDQALPLLAMAKEPLSTQNIFEILHASGSKKDILQIEDALKEASLFINPVTKEDGTEPCWTFYYQNILKNMFSKDSDRNPDSNIVPDDEIDEIANGLIQWCSEWKEHKNPYAMKHYAQHLSETSDPSAECLFGLARNEDFFSLQTHVLGFDLKYILETVRYALEKAIKMHDLKLILEFTLLYSRRYTKLSVSPFKAEDHIAGSRLIGNMENLTDQQVWRLALAWSLSVKDLIEDARKLLVDFLDVEHKNFLHADNYSDAIITFIPHLFKVDKNLTCEIISSLNNYNQERLCRLLIEKNYYDEFNNIIENLNEKTKNKMLREQGRTFLEFGSFSDCDALIKQLPLQDINKFWLILEYFFHTVINIKDPVCIKHSIEYFRLFYSSFPSITWDNALYSEGSNDYLDKIYVLIKLLPDEFRKNIILSAFAGFLTRLSHDYAENDFAEKGKRIFDECILNISGEIPKSNSPTRQFEFIIEKIDALKYFLSGSETSHETICKYYEDIWKDINCFNGYNISVSQDSLLSLAHFYVSSVDDPIKDFRGINKLKRILRLEDYVLLNKEVIRALSRKPHKHPFYRSYIKRKELKSLDRRKSVFVYPVISELGFNNPAGALKLFEEENCRISSDPRFYIKKTSGWGVPVLMQKLALKFEEYDHTSTARNLIDRSKEILWKLKGKNRVCYLCDLASNIYETNGPFNDLIPEIHVDAMNPAYLNPEDLQKNRLSHFLIGSFITTRQPDYEIKKWIKKVSGSAKSLRSEEMFSELIENIFTYKIDILEDVIRDANCSIDYYEKEDKHDKCIRFVCGVMHAMMKSACKNFPFDNRRMEFIKEIINGYHRRYIDHIKKDGETVIPDWYYRAMAEWYMMIGDLEASQKKFSKIKNEDDRSKTCKDLSILLIRKGEYELAKKYALQMKTHISENMPDIISNFLAKGQREYALELYMPSAQFCDSAYRSASFLIQHTRLNYDELLRVTEYVHSLERELYNSFDD